MRLEAPDSSRREVERGASELGSAPAKEVRSEDWNVFDPLPQRRQSQEDRADAEVEIAPESILLDQPCQVPMGRRDQPDIHPTVLYISEAPEASFFEDLEQLGLHRKVHVSDLVEKQRAAVRDFQQSDLARDRSGERPFFVTEEFGLEEIPVETGAIEIQKALLAPGAVVMKPGGEDSLARTGLAPDEDGPVGGEYFPGLLGQRADRRALAEKGVERLPSPNSFVAQPTAPVALVLEGPLKNEKEGRPVDRLHQELLGAHFQGLHGHPERGVVGQDNTGRPRIGGLHEREKIERAAVGEPAARDDGVRPPSPEAVPRRPAGLRLLDFVTVRFQNGLEVPADTGIVIDEQDPLPESGNGTPPGAASVN